MKFVRTKKNDYYFYPNQLTHLNFINNNKINDFDLSDAGFIKIYEDNNDEIVTFHEAKTLNMLAHDDIIKNEKLFLNIPEDFMNKFDISKINEVFISNKDIFNRNIDINIWADIFQDKYDDVPVIKLKLKNNQDDNIKKIIKEINKSKTCFSMYIS